MIWRRRQPEVSQPSSLFDPTKLDLIAQGKAGVVSLYVIQDEPWSNTPEELASLVEKIDNCARFVVGGVWRPVTRISRAWRVVIDTYTGVPAESVLVRLREVSEDLPASTEGILLHELEPPVAPSTVPTTLRVRRLTRHGDVVVDTLAD